MNSYYLIFIILLVLSGVFFGKTVSKIAGFAVSTLGVVSLITYIYYSYWMDVPDNMIAEWPSESYLRTVGAQCPNYWKLLATDENAGKDHVVCKYTLQDNDDNKLVKGCFGNPYAKTKRFTKVKEITYPLHMSSDRKNWLKDCSFDRSTSRTDKPPWIEYNM